VWGNAGEYKLPNNEIMKLQLKRVNAFQGLVIDVDTWQDAHEYHRNQHKIHLLAFHGTGIVQGLVVKANETPDLSIIIDAGLAIDSEGNTIIVSQPQHYKIQTRQKGIIYLIIQFREIPTEPYQPPEGGQATRILEAYRIQERDKLPDEVYLELARIDFDPSEAMIKDAKNPSRPVKNEINLSSRKEIKVAAPAAVIVPERVVPEKITTEAPETKKPDRKSVRLGHVVLGSASKDLHTRGLQNLSRVISQQSDFTVDVDENIDISKNINQYMMLYLTGNSNFELSVEEQTTLNNFLRSGGVIFGEGCSEGEGGLQPRRIREFGLAFNQLAVQLKSKLETVQPGHSLLSEYNIFSEVPRGAESSGLLLEGKQMIYSGSDYGCSWQGGHQDDPLSREIIRSSFEIGLNIIAYAYMSKSGK
jgi:hypothetical protein